MENMGNEQEPQAETILQWKINHRLRNEPALSREQIEAEVKSKLDKIKSLKKTKKTGSIVLWDDRLELITEEASDRRLNDKRRLATYPKVVDTSPMSTQAFLEIQKILGVSSLDVPDIDIHRGWGNRPMDWNKIIPTKIKGVYYHENYKSYPAATNLTVVFVTVNENYKDKISRRKGEMLPAFLLRKAKLF